MVHFASFYPENSPDNPLKNAGKKAAKIHILQLYDLPSAYSAGLPHI